MTSPNSVPGKPKTLDELIPLIGDAIRHAQSLQGTAASAVNGVAAATQTVDDAVVKLEKARGAMAVEIASSVRVQVDKALVDSATTMGATLANAENIAATALGNVSSAANNATGALRDAAGQVAANKMKYLVAGAVLGALITGPAVGAFMAYSDLHKVVTWLVGRPR
jgi:hypothetical protein